MLDSYNRDEGLQHFQRGLVLERSHRVEEAVAAYHQAITYDPHLRDAHNALGFYYQRNGLLAKAADAFRTVAVLEDSFLAYFNLGYVLIELERYDAARDAFQHCLLLEPNDTATHFELGFIYFSCGEFHAAVEHLQSPLRSYPQDWEIHNLLGKCYLGLRNYDNALRSFGQALQLAQTPHAQVEILGNINSVERHREFRSLHTFKDLLYAQDGVIYLGSAHDDGIEVHEIPEYHFTYRDIGTTLQRLVALHESAHWQFTAIVAVDNLTQPLAQALSRLLDLPLRTIDTLATNDRVLLVIAVAREAELLLLTIERMPCSMMTFCLGLNWLRHNRMLPDAIGIAAQGRCSVPWEAELRQLRADGASPAALQACLQVALAQVVQAVHDTPLDTNLPRQIRYYTRKHRRSNLAASRSQLPQ